MKKIFKSRVFAFVLGAIMFSGITAVSAYTILANDIGYTPKDTTWKKTNGEDITNVGDAIDELYDKSDLKKLLDSRNNSFGGRGVNFTGFIVGHKYLAVYSSNFWDYDQEGMGEYSAYINNGAENIKVLTGGCDAAERTTNGGSSCAYLLTFTATDSSISIHYGNSPTYYSMRFIDIS